ncbi:PPR CONTAINING PLANT-LIKE PROTEIN [Salix purpurea]|uniref:PPR CONTAINING PLANT-LIKE PROTEIN n=1 Tax=Salix purpurea TaxID=77065 RepID=A0A9Q0ZI18_SALPP|nr:PPR CONTAINING PLANT-LIKE PROTEIN [Salix purpurea]
MQEMGKHQTLILIQKMVKIPPLQALSLFNCSTQQGFQHTHHSISFLLQHLLDHQKLPHAQSLLLQILSSKISSPFFTVSSLLHHLTQNQNPSMTTALLYESIIDAHLKSQLLDKALIFFNEMVDKGLVYRPNIFNSLLGSLVRSNCFEKAWMVFNELKERVKFDVYSFGIMIKGCCENGNLDKSFQLLGLLQDIGLSPNVVIYTTLIDGCCKNGDIEKARSLFEKMGEMGLVANQYTFTVLINGLFKKGLKKDGFDLFEKMKINGLFPNLYTYNWYSKAGNWKGVADLAREMEGRGISPSKVTCTVLIDAYVRLQDMEKAFQIFSSMERFGLVPDVYVYGVLIHGLCMKGNMKESSKLFRSMAEMHVEPSDVIYNTMIHGYCKEDNSYRALRLLREMEAKGLVPNVASYSSIIGVLCKDGKWQESEVLLDKMIELQLKPSASILNMISKAKNFTELKI